LRSDETAENWVETHDVKISAVDDAGLDFARFTEADHGKADSRKIAKRSEGVDSGFDVLEFRDGEIYVPIADTQGTLEDVDEAMLVRVDEWAKEDAAYEAEDGGVGADAESKSQDDGESQTLGARERTKGKSQILSEQSQCLHLSLLTEPGILQGMLTPSRKPRERVLQATFPD
jgi:hypothetical protein